MCEAHAYILSEGEEKIFLENVDEVDVMGDEIRLVNIFGEQKIVKALIKRYSNAEGKLLLETIP